MAHTGGLDKGDSGLCLAGGADSRSRTGFRTAMETKRKKAAKGKKRAVMCRQPHRLPVFSPLGVCWESGSRPLTHRAVRRCCSVVSHTIAFECVRLSRMGATQHCPVCLKRRAGLTFSEGPVCPVVKRRSLPLCHCAPMPGPQLRWFYLVCFFSLKSLSKTMKTAKTSVFRCPDHAGAASTP